MNAVKFDDGKEAGALRTIGEVSAALGIKAHVLRYWEQQFPTLDPLKRSGGRRYYRPEDIALLQQIDALVNQHGYTLKGARQALQEGKGPAVAKSSDDGDAPHYPIPGSAPIAGENASGDAETGPDTLDRLKQIRADLASALDG